MADKLIEVMDYYGFDGYFFNQESYGCSSAEGELIDEMMRYMHEKRPDMLISWYDSHAARPARYGTRTQSTIRTRTL